ncbi:MAG: hypothetical protein AB1734_04940 [Elusimicrobiota bacterium]
MKSPVRILAFFAALLALPPLLPSVNNPDIFWHLSAGRRMAETGALIRADFLSWTMPGEPWTNFEWLVQFIYHHLFSAGGWTALFIFKISLLAACLFPLWRILRLHGREGWAAMTLPFFSLAMLPMADLRPDNFSILLFLILLWRLEALRLSGGTPSARQAAAGAVFFAAWANLHPGCLFGLALTGFYAAGAFIEGRGRGWRGWAGLLAAGAAALLVNPNGWELYRVAFQHQAEMGLLKAEIAEWAAPDITIPAQAPGIILMGAALIAILWSVARRRMPPAAHILALAFFVWAAASHSRNLMFSAAAAMAFIPPLLPAVNAGLKPAAAQAAAVLAAFALAWGPARASFTAPHGSAFSSPPTGAFLRANAGDLSRLKLFNTWNWGAWLGYEAAPAGYKVFADGRYLFHPMLAEFAAARNDIGAWKEMTEKYAFDLAVLPPGPGGELEERDLNGKKVPFVRPDHAKYFPPEDWAVLFWDRNLAVFVRRTAPPPFRLSSMELRYLRPGELNNALELARAGLAPLPVLRDEARRLLLFQADSRASAAGPVRAWLDALEKACREPGAACR